MDILNRRQFGGVVAAATAIGVVGRATANDNAPAFNDNRFGLMHDRKPPTIGMLLYPGLTLMDLLGPQTVMSTSCIVHLIWKTKDFIESDCGVVLKPNTTFADCPKDLDVLFVGGGGGQFALMNDDETLQFLADRGSRAKFVTSVCSGSLLLGAAGLLREYESTSHWSYLGALRLFGAKPVSKRVVVDRNRLSGGGVTAGIDFGLVLLAKLLGDDVAKMTQLAMEYDPEPPFDAGSPQKAGPEITRKVQDWMRPFEEKFQQACEQAAKALPK